MDSLYRRRIKKVSTIHYPLDWSNRDDYHSAANCTFNKHYAEYYDWIIFYNLNLKDTSLINWIIDRYKGKKLLFYPKLTNDDVYIWDSYLSSGEMGILDLSKIDKIKDFNIKFKSLLLR